MVRTPEEYLNSLRDGRVIYYRGKLVTDVTTHEVLRVPLITQWNYTSGKAIPN